MQTFTVWFKREDGVTKIDLLTRDEVVAADAVGEIADKGVYEFTVELTESVSKAFELDSGGAQVEPTVVIAGGWHETKVFKEYEGFDEFRESCEAHGISLDFASAASEGSASDEPTDSLTDRQREVLTLAVPRGYYESPRQTTAEGLAAKLGTLQSSLSSFLRRGERELITSSPGMQARMQPPTQ